MNWSVAQAGKATIGGVKESSRQSLSNAKSSLKTTINNKESIADAFLQALEGTRKSAIEGTTSTISIKCKVAETPKSGDSNIYTVIYQEQKLQAISSSKEVTYNVGDTVLAIVPNGDFSDILNITGLYSAIEEEAITDEEYYEQVSPNLIKNQNEPYHLKTWVPSEQIYEISNTDAQLLWNSLFKEDTKLCFSFDVLTQINELYRGQGNYGVKIRLPIKSTGTITEQGVSYNGEFTPVRRVEELPVASAKTMNALYLIFEDAENVVYEGVEGDPSTIISDAIYDFDYSPYDTITFVGGNYDSGHGESWQQDGDTATVTNPSEGDTFIIKSEGGRYAQGTYTFTATGIRRTRNNYNHCGIVSITGHYSVPQLHTYITVLEDDEYKWQIIDYVVDENDLVSQTRTQDIYDYQDIVVFDTNTMLGDPYEYDVKATQKFYIDIDPDIQYVNYSELRDYPVQIVSFVDDNWTYPTDYEDEREWDVEFSNLQIFEVKPVPEEYQNGYYFILTAPADGTLFVDNTGTIQLLPLLRYKMKEVSLNSEQYFCYWFKKNSSIKADSKKYLPIGGLGWEVLNGISEDSGKYLNDSFAYTVQATDIFLEGVYKCVLVPTNNIPENKAPETIETGYFEAEILLTKLNSGIEVSLTSNMDGIACNPTSTVNLTATIKYEADSDPAINFNFSRYNQDGNFIESSFGEIISTTSQVIKVKSTTKVYEIIQTYKFSAGIIPYNSFNTIVCSFGVIDENSQIQDVGDASLILRVGNSDKYILNIYGEAFYKYDTYGNAPTLDTYAGSGSRVVQIKPLSFKMINSNGKEFDFEEYIGWTFKWGIPKNSLIKVDVSVLSERYAFTEDDNYYYFSSDQYSLNEIGYEIENRFDKTKAENNTVTLELVNGTDTLLTNVQITFTKDGLAGTNGSSYSAVVVASVTNPNIYENTVDETVLGTWPPSLADKGYEYGELVSSVGNLPAKLQAFYYNEKWYFFFPNWMSRFTQNTSPNEWISKGYLDATKAVPTFNVKVMKEGKEIAEVVSSDDTKSTTNGYTVEWSMLTNIDEKGMNRDSNVYVNFNINKETGVLSVKDRASAEWDSNSKVFFNIVQAKIKVANSGLVGEDSDNKNYEYLFAYYPIEVTKIEDISAFPTGKTVNLFPQLSGGFNEVIYRSDGLEPSYVNDENFTLSNYNEVSKNKDFFNYNWVVSRNLYLTNEEETQAEFEDEDIEHTDDIHDVTRVIKPISNFDNGISANYVKVSYGYDEDKEEELNNEKEELENKNEDLYKKVAYLTARHDTLFNKYEYLMENIVRYDLHCKQAFNDRYILLKKIAYNKEDIATKVEDQNSIVGAARIIINFMVEYFDQSSPHQYLYTELIRECNGIYNIASDHYQKFELLNRDGEAIDNLNELPFISNYNALTNADFKNGVSAEIVKEYIINCNTLISAYNPLFVKFKRASQPSLKDIFVDIKNRLENIVDISSFTNNQTISIPEHEDIVINLSTDYNPIESEKVGDVVDYFINKNLIKILPIYLDIYQDEVITFDDLKDKVRDPISEIRTKIKDQIQVYYENVTVYNEEIQRNKNKIDDLTEKINYINDNKNIGLIHIKPILFITDTAEFGALHGWDGVSANTLTDDDIGECLYQPQVGAGEWDPETNSFKGLIIGVKKFVDAQGNKHFMRGMFGYGPNAQGGSGSQQTLLLNSDTGQLILGDRLAARITVDPQFQRLKLNAKDNKDTETVGALYSGNFFKEYKTDGSWMPSSYEENNEAHAGLLIDFTTPEIRFGNGNFELDTFGNLYAGGTGSIAAWKLSDHSLTSKNDTKSSLSNNQSLTLLSGKRAVYWLPSVENPQPITNISSLDTTKITYDSSAAKVDEYGQPMAVLIKTTLNEGGTLKRNRTVLRKVYLDDPEHVPAIYSNNHDEIKDNTNKGFYLSQEGLSILGEYQTQDFDSNGIETLSSIQKSRIEINTTDKPTIFSGSRVAFDTRKKGFYIGEDGISLYNDKYYERNIAADGSYEVATVDGEDYPVYLSNSGDRLICYYNEEGYVNRYEFRVIDNDNNLTTTTKLPKTKSGGIYLSVDSLKMPSLYSKTSDSLTSTSDGFYLSDCGISLGSKFKVTNEGITYIGNNAVQYGGFINGATVFSTSENYKVGDYVVYNDTLYRCTTAHSAGEWNQDHFTSVNTKFWTINGNNNESYISYNANYLIKPVGQSYSKNSVFLSTNGFRLGRTFLVDVDNDSLKIGNLNNGVRYWELKGNSGNAYLAYNCIGTYTSSNKTYSDLGSCVYEGEKTYYTNQAGTKFFKSIEYTINAEDEGEMIDVEDDDADASSPSDTGSFITEKDSTEQGDLGRIQENTDTEDNITTVDGYKVHSDHTKSVYIGTNGIRIGQHFGVNPKGEAVLKAGTIGAWTINKSKIVSVVGVTGSKKRKYVVELDAKDGLSCYQLNKKAHTNKLVTPIGTENPQAQGWYEIIDGRYVETQDTHVVSGKNYYDGWWKKKVQWYIKPNGRAYFRKFQVKKGEENYIELVNGSVGNFTASPTGLTNGTLYGTVGNFTAAANGLSGGKITSSTEINSDLIAGTTVKAAGGRYYFDDISFVSNDTMDSTLKSNTTVNKLRPVSDTVNTKMNLTSKGLFLLGSRSTGSGSTTVQTRMHYGNNRINMVAGNGDSTINILHIEPGSTQDDAVEISPSGFTVGGTQIYASFADFTTLENRINTIMNGFITKMNTALSSIRVVRADSSSETGSSANSYVYEADSRTSNATTPAQGDQHDHSTNRTTQYLKVTYNEITT